MRDLNNLLKLFKNWKKDKVTYIKYSNVFHHRAGRTTEPADFSWHD